MKAYRNDEAKKNTIGYGGLIAALALVGMAMAGTGCSGIELGGKVGLYRIDERQESQRTYRNPKPFICYLMPSRCAGQAPEDVQGS